MWESGGCFRLAVFEAALMLPSCCCAKRMSAHTGIFSLGTDCSFCQYSAYKPRSLICRKCENPRPGRFFAHFYNSCYAKDPFICQTVDANVTQQVDLSSFRGQVSEGILRWSTESEDSRLELGRHVGWSSLGFLRNDRSAHMTGRAILISSTRK